MVDKNDIVCSICGEKIGFSIVNKNGYYQEYDNENMPTDLNYEFIGSEDIQYIKDTNKNGEIICGNCIEIMNYESRIKISHNGKLENIGFFDPRNNIIGVILYLSDNTMVEQNLIDILKQTIYNKDYKNKDIVELKRINKLLNYYSYDEKDRKYINKVIDRLMHKKNVLVVNLQDTLGNFGLNQYFVVKNIENYI